MPHQKTPKIIPIFPLFFSFLMKKSILIFFVIIYLYLCVCVCVCVCVRVLIELKKYFIIIYMYIILPSINYFFFTILCLNIQRWIFKINF